MKKILWSLALLSLTAGSARAGLVLSTTNPPGTPLNMSPSTISGPMLLNVTSDTPPNDVMAGWQVQLEIIPITGTGTLIFNDPATGTPANPPGYVFGANGLGISAIAKTIHPYPTQAEVIKRLADAYNRTLLTLLVKKLMSGWLKWQRR